jgi:hypothetical protein
LLFEEEEDVGAAVLVVASFILVLGKTEGLGKMLFGVSL